MLSDDDAVAYLASDDPGFASRPGADESASAELDEVRALLAEEATWIEPGAGLEDSVVAAIAAEASAPPAAPTPQRADWPAPPPVIAGRPRRHLATRAWRSVAAVAAAAVVAVLAAVVLIARDGDDGTDRLSAALEPTDVVPGISGSATLERTDSGWRIELDAPDLPRLDDGEFYQAWLRNADGVSAPIGTFNEGDDVVLWAGVSPLEFTTLTVTREQADGEQDSSGVLVLAGPVVDD
jgi:hypothetical protein